jgi:hypothetical protein
MPDLFSQANKDKKVLVFGHGLIFNAMSSSGIENKPSIAGSAFLNKLEWGESQVHPLFVD